MREIKKHIIILSLLAMMMGMLTACSSNVTTYTYEKEEIDGVKIEKTEIH